MNSSFGHFRSDGTEFVVTEADTPRALTNYFWNSRLISGVSQHGGGDGTYKQRAMQYVDPRGRSLMVRDGHRYFYLRDQADGSVWSPGWHPVQAKLDDFQCTHGLGYSIIESRCRGVRARLRVFVGPDEPCEIWTVTLTNLRDAAAELKLFTFVDWDLTGYPIYSDYLSYLHGEYLADAHAALSLNTAVERTHDVFGGFVASDLAPSGFDTSRRAFLGSFGHVAMPRAVAGGKCTGSLAECERLVGALEHTLMLGPGQSRTFNVFIGATGGAEMTRGIVTRLRAEGAVEAQFDAVKRRMAERIERVRVDTPNEHVNYLVNGWIKRQIQLYAEVGSDNGRGFRDAMQLLWATASYDPDYTRTMLDECLRHQFADGHTLRGWLPIDDHHYSDGPVWIAPVVDAYLKETHDAAILDHVVPYFDEGAGTVWDHVLRGLRCSAGDLGPHGLVRCHFGDWNDSLTGVGIEGRGESVWTSIAIVYSLKVAAGIAAKVRRSDDEVRELAAHADKLTAAVNAHAWDGQWYLRAINDRGEKIGTHTDAEGRIWLNPQVWAILAGIVDDERRDLLYRMVDEHLETDYGSLTLTPAFTRHNPGIGRVTAMRPGIWENGTPYCHSNGFKIIADCVGGRGDRAHESFLKALPDSRWNPSTHSGCEPYALTNMYLGPENPRAGQTQFAWMTGTAGWYYRALTEWMLGVRADYDGLLIDPCLPSRWKQCGMQRRFRGARYDIRISNPAGIEKGTPSIRVDGKPIAGNLVPVFDDGKTHVVDVELKR